MIKSKNELKETISIIQKVIQMQIVLIPAERIKVLMDPAVKKEVETRSGIKLSIAEEGEIEITSEDPVGEWRSLEIIKAIGRGFEPRTALKLLDEEYVFKLVSLKEIFPSEKQRIRYKSRVIGTGGKVKTTIEEIADVHISIYGNTIGIIGKMEGVGLAGKAIDMILNGSSHGSVFMMLRKARQKMQNLGL